MPKKPLLGRLTLPARNATPGASSLAADLESPQLSHLAGQLGGNLAMNSPLLGNPGTHGFPEDGASVEQSPTEAAAAPTREDSGGSSDISPLSPSSKRKSRGFGVVAVSEAPMRPPPARVTRSTGLLPEDGSECSSPTKKARNKPAPFHVVDIFTTGMYGRRVFRIPALLPLPGGVVLAFAEARTDWHDSGTIDLVIRRSEDDGVTWSPVRTLINGRMLKLPYECTVGNPAPLWDAVKQRVVLLLCSNHGDDNEWMIHARQSNDTRRVWTVHSDDFGVSWSKPREITSAVKLSQWTWYATGPGLGLQLRSGRLMVPCNHALDVEERHHPFVQQLNRSRMVAHVIFSDDHGETWQLGGNAADHTNETTLAQLADGQLMLNSRDWSGRFLRVVQTSSDEGKTWEPKRLDKVLTEPQPWGCQGSILALPAPDPNPGGAEGSGTDGEGGSGKSRSKATPPSTTLFFCNPADPRQRERLTLRRSEDCGRTWGAAFVVEAGPSAYSALGLLSNRRLGLLYERADRIAFATLSSSFDGPIGAF